MRTRPSDAPYPMRRFALLCALAFYTTGCDEHATPALSTHAEQTVQALAPTGNLLLAARYPHGFHSECLPGRACDAPAGINLQDPGTGDMSIAFAFRLSRDSEKWVKDAQGNDTTTLQTHALVGKGNYRSTDPGFRFFVEWHPAQQQWALYFRATALAGGTVHRAAVTKWLGADAAALDRWFHVTGVLDRPSLGDVRNELRLYLDDMFEPQVGGGAGATGHRFATTAALTSPEDLTIGWARGPNNVQWQLGRCDGTKETMTAKERQTFRGYIDEVRIYARALNRSDVTQTYQAWRELDFREVEIFRRTNQYCYRIPAIVAAPDGELFAFAERRHGWAGKPCDDAGNHDIVLRRSADGGRTWGKEWLVVDAADFKLPTGDASVTNASPVFDASGRLLLFFGVTTNDDLGSSACPYSSGCGTQEGRVKSVNPYDHAHVWRRAYRKMISFPATGNKVDAGYLQELTTVLKQSSNLGANVRWHAFGPGHAIRLDASALNSAKLASRATHDILAVPLYHNYLSGNGSNPDSVEVGRPTVLYYDATTNEAVGIETLSASVGSCSGDCSASELQAAQLSPGTLMLNARRVSKTCAHTRREYTFASGATAWIGRQDPVLVDPISAGSLLALSGSDELAQTSSACWSNDWKNVGDVVCGSHRFRMRRNVTVRLKSDTASTWTWGRVIREGSSGYSDLVKLSNDRLGLLYEAPRGDARGDWTFNAANTSAATHTALCNAGLPVLENAGAFYENGITFASFSLAWVKAGDDGNGRPLHCDDTVFLDEEKRACAVEENLSDFSPQEICAY